MNAFTGGCHFDGGCGRFRDSCGRCPQLESQSENDLSSQSLGRKVATAGKIGAERLTVVGPSRWLTEEARRSAVLGRFESLTIPYGLETDVFRPRERSVVRQLVDIPEDAKVVLFLADGLSNRRKGFDLLVKALGSLGRLENTYLMAVGEGTGEAASQLRIPLKVIPTVKDDRFLSFIYSAADVFAMASRADNLPNTVLESLACGTPVVAFSVGGIPDLVVPEETGLLVAEGDTAALAGALERVLGDDELRQSMSLRGREAILERHTLERQATEYVDLYSRVLSARPAAVAQN
jgi:glycosyltransferase involved in cell wall biosynthesis